MKFNLLHNQTLIRDNTAGTRSRNGISSSHQSSFSTLYRLIDLAVISLCFFAALYYYSVALSTSALLLLFTSVVVYQLSAEGLDLYRSWRSSHITAMIRTALYAGAISFFVTLCVGFFLPPTGQLPTQETGIWFASALVTLSVWRIAMRQVLFSIRRSGLNSRSAIIIGANDVALNMANQMIENDQLGIHFQGMYDDRPMARVDEQCRQHLNGSIDQAIEMARRRQVDYIYIALPTAAEERIKAILEKCSDTTANVYLIPNFFMHTLLHSRWQSVGNVQALSIYDTPFQGASNILKRVEDVVLGSVLLAMLALPMLAISAAVKLTSPGPAIFRQKRYGLDGKEITVYKFRSMTTQDNGEIVKQATKNDPRVTPLGAFLRRTSLDELPQFINVLQGRMSIVGPRPHAIAHNEQYRKLITGYMLRHKVKPGITGWAQVNGLRGETETVDKMAKRVAYDLDYMHRWSVIFDLKIIFKTMTVGFKSPNAY